MRTIQSSPFGSSDGGMEGSSLANAATTPGEVQATLTVYEPRWNLDWRTGEHETEPNARSTRASVEPALLIVDWSHTALAFRVPNVHASLAGPPSLAFGLPFAELLLSIALMPLLRPHVWERHFALITAG
ncbi:sodium:proton antiporter [Lichenibacterium ramalinae]|nr:sodium:proton antiporter [Lichenibacterium ramalinae]